MNIRIGMKVREKFGPARREGIIAKIPDFPGGFYCILEICLNDDVKFFEKRYQDLVIIGGPNNFYIRYINNLIFI